MECHPISSRLISIRLVATPKNICIIQVYAPTSTMDTHKKRLKNILPRSRRLRSEENSEERCSYNTGRLKRFKVGTECLSILDLVHVGKLGLRETNELGTQALGILQKDIMRLRFLQLNSINQSINQSIESKINQSKINQSKINQKSVNVNQKSRSINQSINQSINLSIYISIRPSVRPSIHLSIYLTSHFSCLHSLDVPMNSRPPLDPIVCHLFFANQTFSCHHSSPTLQPDFLGLPLPALPSHLKIHTFLYPFVGRLFLTT